MRIIDHMKRMEALAVDSPPPSINIHLTSRSFARDSSDTIMRRSSSVRVGGILHGSSSDTPNLMGNSLPQLSSLGHAFGHSSVVLDQRGSTPFGGGSLGTILTHHTTTSSSNTPPTAGASRVLGNSSRTPTGKLHSSATDVNNSSARGPPTPLSRARGMMMAGSMKQGNPAAHSGFGQTVHEDKEWMYNLDHLQSEYEKRNQRRPT